jgi:uncharacterized protein (TIGR02466 family)
MKDRFNISPTWRGLKALFQTPVYVAEWSAFPDHRRGLLDDVNQWVADRGADPTTNVGGLRTTEGFFQSVSTQHSRALLEFVESGVHDFVEAFAASSGAAGTRPRPRMSVNAWVNFSVPHTYKKPHMHHNCNIAGSFYLDVGRAQPTTESDSGLLEFLDPRPGAATSHHPAFTFVPPRFKVRPEGGCLILFPSWLIHYVNPVSIDQDSRISFGFDIVLEQ